MTMSGIHPDTNHRPIGLARPRQRSEAEPKISPIRNARSPKSLFHSIDLLATSASKKTDLDECDGAMSPPKSVRELIERKSPVMKHVQKSPKMPAIQIFNHIHPPSPPQTTMAYQHAMMHQQPIFYHPYLLMAASPYMTSQMASTSPPSLSMNTKYEPTGHVSNVKISPKYATELKVNCEVESLTASDETDISVIEERRLMKNCEDLLPSMYKTRGKGHVCIYCGKLYSRKYGLKIHLRTHTGYKPLKCKVCQRPFGDPSNLNKHIRLHAQGDTPYRCEHCGKVLVRRRDLERHIKSRHPDEQIDVIPRTTSTDGLCDTDIESEFLHVHDYENQGLDYSRQSLDASQNSAQFKYFSHVSRSSVTSRSGDVISDTEAEDDVNPEVIDVENE